MKNTILIKDFLPSVISTRKSFTNLITKLNLSEKNTYIFDFSDISFISRSFTDEFLNYSKSTNINWKIKNANNNIKAMIDAVRKSQESPRKNYDYVAINNLKTKSDLHNFLSTI